MPAEIAPQTPSNDASAPAARQHRILAGSERPAGWYNCRKTYRSVAYGTWTVGAARKLMTSQSDYELQEPAEGAKLLISPCVSTRSDTTHRKLANGWRRPDEVSSDQESTTDCYSAEDYLRFRSLNLHHPSTTTDEDLSTGEPTSSAEVDQSLQNVLESFRDLRNYTTLRPSKKKQKKKPALFHKRSASAGSEAIFSVHLPPTLLSPKKFSCPSPSASYSATKNFLRKICSNHLPLKQQSLPPKPAEPRASLAEMDSCSISPSPSSSAGETPPLKRNGLRVSETSPLLFSDVRSRPPPFRNWDDAYRHLRTELDNIRLRDILILRNFQKLEQDLRGVKMAHQDGPSPIVEVPPNLENAFSAQSIEFGGTLL